MATSKARKKFSSKVQEKLGFYVYLYIDPRTGEPFYIGKGQRNRAFSHLNDESETEKARVIKQIRKADLEPQIEILKYGLTEEQALLVEATAIDLLDVRKLTNCVRGHGIRYGARAPVDEVSALLDAKKVTIDEPVMLIVINRAFRYGMTAQELYDATRCAWKLGNKREKAKFAFAVYRRVVREVYTIAHWLKAGSTMRVLDRDGRRDETCSDRWEFVGTLAPDRLRRKYVGMSVAQYIPKGARNPILYVNCERSQEPGREDCPGTVRKKG